MSRTLVGAIVLEHDAARPWVFGKWGVVTVQFRAPKIDPKRAQNARRSPDSRGSRRVVCLPAQRRQMPVVTGLDVQSQVRARSANAALVSGDSQGARLPAKNRRDVVGRGAAASQLRRHCRLAAQEGDAQAGAITRDESSKRVSSKGLNAAMPALLTNACGRAQRCAIESNELRPWPGKDTSACSARQRAGSCRGSASAYPHGTG